SPTVLPHGQDRREVFVSSVPFFDRRGRGRPRVSKGADNIPIWCAGGSRATSQGSRAPQVRPPRGQPRSAGMSGAMAVVFLVRVHIDSPADSRPTEPIPGTLHETVRTDISAPGITA